MNNILIVDDRPETLRLLMGILTKQGYDVRAAADGETALQSACLSPPDLILLDIMMPGMDGYEVCTRLKSDDRTRDIPVIFISAMNAVVDKVKAFALGGVDYITKPFQRDEVLVRVNTHLTLRQMQRDLEAQNAQLQQEIATRKQTEDRLRESEERLRLVVETVPLPIIMTRPDTREVLLVNEAFCELFGYSRNEILSKSSPELYAYPDQDRALILQELRESQMISQREIQGRKADGTVFDILLSYKLIDYTGRPAALASIYDLTERKWAEEQMRLDEERLESLLNLSQMKETSLQSILDAALEEAIQLTRSQIGYIYYYDEVTQRFTLSFWSKEAMHACTVTDPQTIYELEKTGLWGEAVRQRKPIIVNDYDAPNPFKKGYPEGYVPLKTFLTIPVISDGQIVAVIGVGNKADAYDSSDIRQLTLLMESVWNISQRKQVETQLRIAKDTAEAANQAKSKFLANMSHELRTPLNGILGYTQILKRDALLNGHQMKAIDIIHRSGEHLLDMINDVLDLAKIEADKIKLQSIEFSLASLLATIVDMMRIKAQQKGVEFVYKSTSHLPESFLGDEKRLRQVLINLLGNAIKFTLEGQVMFRVSTGVPEYRDAGEDSQFSNSPTLQPSNPATLRFDIEDSGIGIPPEKMTTIFHPFEQVNDPRVKIEGTGLGLAISDRIVQLMGSKIRVDSTPEKGSRFWFEMTLPVIKSDVSAPVTQTQRIVGIKNRTYTLLLVDDHEGNRQVLQGMLHPLGFELAEASNGQEALEQVPIVRPDLILLDLKMPIMDGYEALPRLRALEVPAYIPIIVLTAGVHDHIRQQSLEAGCDDFLTKPVQLDELLMTIERHLQVEWRYDEQPPIAPSSSEGLSLILPSREEFLALDRAAVIGDIMEIRRSLDRFEQSDPALLPFVKQLRELSENFEIDLIQKILRHHLNMNQPNNRIE